MLGRGLAASKWEGLHEFERRGGGRAHPLGCGQIALGQTLEQPLIC
jgi:hypothetical protein